MTMNHEKLRMVTLVNGQSVELDAIALLAPDAFQTVIADAVDVGHRVASLFAASARQRDVTQLFAVLVNTQLSRLHIVRTEIHDGQYPSLTNRCPQVHLFEREIAEQFGIKPVGHPWFKPVRSHGSWTGRDAWDRSASEEILPGVCDFYQVEGEEVHEVAVGPVHAGIIEPGHFRFQCHGELVFHLEIALGFQHRGVEDALIGGPDARSIHYAETLAGDSTIAHTTAYCRVIEALSKCRKTARAQTLRGIALELERMANHVGDLGALAGDIGFLPTMSYCGRIRGDFLNMTALLCGNRFGRGMVCPGGVGFDMDDARVEKLLRQLDAAEKDATVAIELLWDTPSAMARFENIGRLPKQVALDLGMVGPAARAAGVEVDTRNDQPSGVFRFTHIPVSTYDTGDVFGRAYVRWLEIQHSIQFLREQLQTIPSGDILNRAGSLLPNRIAVSLDEGWRGEVCHVGITDDEGRFMRYKVVDPSFHNWPGLAYALRNQQISDFPLCNKSFNLSYCGHDL